MATQTLPHGYCGLPVQKSCPHANACLTCPVFVTGPEFLPELREHRSRTLTLIDKAEAGGHTRMAHMNTTVLTNLDTMIGQLEPVSYTHLDVYKRQLHRRIARGFRNRDNYRLRMLLIGGGLILG